MFASCESKEVVEPKTKISRPLGTDLEVFWTLKENNYKGKSAYLTEFVIQNNSKDSLKHNWAIYFHQPRTVDIASVSPNVKITHISGDYFKVEPSDKFIPIANGESVTFTYESNWWAIKLVDAPVGLYVVYTDAKGEESIPEVLTNVYYDPMLEEVQTKRTADDPLKVPTPNSRFELNSKTIFAKKGDLLSLIPTPVSYTKKEGAFNVKNGLVIGYNKGLKNEAEFLMQKLMDDFKIESTVKEGVEGDIVISVSKGLKVKNKTTEAYNLDVTESKVTIKGSDSTGVFYGIQSLRNLIPVKAFTNSDSAIVKCISIQDAPRFDYRGMHLDVARNFQKKESVLKLIDLMSLYKLNKFHFHITDDEGWRIEIKELPELTLVGSKRGHTRDESTMLNPAYGSGPFPSDDSHGTGYYTQADFIEILQYAKARHVEVIPELDFPGHARAAIVSMKAREKRLIAEGNEKEASKYILHDPNDASTYESVQLYDDNVVNVCQESTYRFLEVVVGEVDSLYKKAGLKLKMVHIGGDEVPHPKPDEPDHGAWIKSPSCKSILDVDSNYNKADELFYYFVDRFSKILADRGIVTSGWEEIGMKKIEDEEGELLPVANETFLGRNFVPFVWNTVWGWGAEDRGYLLANAGYKVVLSNVNNLYFDLSYDKDPADPGYYWGGFVDTRKAWGFIPLDIYKGELEDNMGGPVKESYIKDKTRLTEAGKKNVYGIQGQLWSEAVKGSDMMEYALFPKMFGLVERAWAQDPAWTKIEDKEKRLAAIQLSWNNFASRIGYFELPKLTYLNDGVNYRIAPPGVMMVDGKLQINDVYPGFEYRYTTDGTDPTAESPLYTEAVEIGATVKKIKVAGFNLKGRSSRISTIEL